MCGRITLTSPAELVAELFGLAAITPLDARYNIAPSQPIATVRADSSTGTRRLHEVRWGLIPSWADDPAIGNRMINARAESLTRKAAFREAFRKRRCLVVADGFYEWRGTGRAKQAFLLRAADRMPFGIAGLWEVWRDREGRGLETATIVTTDANSVMRPIHDRMPVIVPPSSFAAWLDPKLDDTAPLSWLLAARDDGVALEAVPVSNHVNDPRHDDPRCVEEEPVLL
jgi:putative SOS response-associated peptidase YedK